MGGGLFLGKVMYNFLCGKRLCVLGKKCNNGPSTCCRPARFVVTGPIMNSRYLAVSGSYIIVCGSPASGSFNNKLS